MIEIIKGMIIKIRRYDGEMERGQNIKDEMILIIRLNGMRDLIWWKGRREDSGRQSVRKWGNGER